MTPFEERLPELGVWRTPITPEDLAVLAARAQLVEAGEKWLSGWLWRYRLATWVASLETSSCQSCGRDLAGRRKGTVFCGSACAQVSRRARASGRRTPHGERLELAQKNIRGMQDQLGFYRGWAKAGGGRSAFPIDLTSVDNLPAGLHRCGAGCTVTDACKWTQGVCLFGATACQGYHDL